MIGILDLGLGNINAFLAAYNKLNIPSKRITGLSNLSEVKKLIIPGVGNFDAAIKKLDESGLREAILKKLSNNELTILGVCVGFQIAADKSHEGEMIGLSIYPGTFEQFDNSIVSPHLGWNVVDHDRKSLLFEGIDMNSEFYFFHSYYLPRAYEKYAIAFSNNNKCFIAAVKRGSFYGVQFHPEKSHKNGLIMLSNFYHLC